MLKSCRRAETVKLSSHYLRGTIAKELTEPADKFNKDNAALLKFHGTYQQDDREHRVKQEGGKSLRQYIFMGALGHTWRQIDERAVAGRTGDVRRAGKRHAANHEPTRIATTWRAEAQLAGNDSPHQRNQVIDLGGRAAT